MALRTFPDGHTWTVWRVQPARGAQTRHGIPTEWLAFQIDDESERRRLREIPHSARRLSRRCARHARRGAGSRIASNRLRVPLRERAREPTEGKTRWSAGTRLTK